MQWLINLVAESVIAKIGIPPVFVDRGDVAEEDWNQDDLTLDVGWHDLDVSGIVPENASAILFGGSIRDGAANSFVFLRKHGHTGMDNVSALMTQVADVVMQQDAIVKTTDTGKIEYITSVDIEIIKLTVRGWWL